MERKPKQQLYQQRQNSASGQRNNSTSKVKSNLVKQAEYSILTQNQQIGLQDQKLQQLNRSNSIKSNRIQQQQQEQQYKRNSLQVKNNQQPNSQLEQQQSQYQRKLSNQNQQQLQKPPIQQNRSKIQAQEQNNQDILTNFLQNKQLPVKKSTTSSITTKKTIPRAPNLSTRQRCEERLQQKLAMSNSQFDRINYHLVREIFCYCASEYSTIINIMKTCKKFYQIVDTCYQIWQSALSSMPKSQIDTLFKMYPQFESLPEKQKIQIIKQLVVQQEHRGFKFTMSSENFTSHILFKVSEQIQVFKFYTTDYIDLSLRFYSNYLKTSVTIKQKYDTKKMLKAVYAQKAFQYFLDQNLLFSLFEGDEQFLYFMFEISSISLMRLFYEELQQRIVMKNNKKNKNKFIQNQKFFEKEIVQSYENFQQYVNYQADFEISLNIHNSQQKNLFTYINTKYYPKNFDNKEAYFKIKTDEPFYIENEFYLDNKMGIKEKVINLVLMDLVVKDRDNFLITFSGFIYMRQLQNNEKIKLDEAIEFYQEEFTAKVLEYEAKNLYKFSILVIQEGKSRGRLKQIELTIYPSIIQRYLQI